MSAKARRCAACKKVDVEFEQIGPRRQRRTCARCTKHYCYIVTDGARRRYYRGYTVDPARRLRQHRGEIAGGARSTKRMRDPEFALVLQNFSSGKHALRFEALMKHHRPRARSLPQAVAKALALIATKPEYSHVAACTDQFS